MDTLQTPWIPRVGDRVTIKRSGRAGAVLKISGAGSDRRFILPRTLDGRTAYWLEEITPADETG